MTTRRTIYDDEEFDVDQAFGTSDEYAASLAACKARLAASPDDGSDDLPF